MLPETEANVQLGVFQARALSLWHLAVAWFELGDGPTTLLRGSPRPSHDLAPRPRPLQVSAELLTAAGAVVAASSRPVMLRHRGWAASAARAAVRWPLFAFGLAEEAQTISVALFQGAPTSPASHAERHVLKRRKAACLSITAHSLRAAGQHEKKSLPFAALRVQLNAAPSQGGGPTRAPQVYSATAAVVRPPNRPSGARAPPPQSSPGRGLVSRGRSPTG